MVEHCRSNVLRRPCKYICHGFDLKIIPTKITTRRKLMEINNQTGKSCISWEAQKMRMFQYQFSAWYSLTMNCRQHTHFLWFSTFTMVCVSSYWWFLRMCRNWFVKIKIWIKYSSNSFFYFNKCWKNKV